MAASALADGRLRFLIVSTHHHSISGDPLTHQKCLAELQRLAVDAKVTLVKIPHFDMEVRTVYGLRVVGSAIFSAAEQKEAK